MSGKWLISVALLAAACGSKPATAPSTVLEFLEPEEGASIVRDVLSADGALVAPVVVQLAVPAELASVELHLTYFMGETNLGTLAGDYSTSLEITHEGPARLTAVARGPDGAVVSEAEVDFVVESPPVSTCTDWLDLYKLDWEAGQDEPGVSDPVVVTMPLNGLDYRYVSSTDVRDTQYMDCELALSLAGAASHLRKRELVEVWDIGVYNYRCIGGGTPPDCPNGISQHAYAKAIDLAGFTRADGTTYSVNDDWMIDPSGEPTCEAGTSGYKDAFLHELICELKEADVWTVVLTPNYNAAHRNHFHVDLTAGSDYIRYEYGVGVDVGPDNH